MEAGLGLLLPKQNVVDLCSSDEDAGSSKPVAGKRKKQPSVMVESAARRAKANEHQAGRKEVVCSAWGLNPESDKPPPDIVDLVSSDDDSSPPAKPVARPGKKKQKAKGRAVREKTGGGSAKAPAPAPAPGQEAGAASDDMAAAKSIFALFKDVSRESKQGTPSQGVFLGSRATLVSALRQLESRVPQATKAAPPVQFSPHCTVCFEAWDGAETMAADLPKECGGSAFICTSCLGQHLKVQIESTEVVPWITTPAPSNNTPLPLDAILHAGLSDTVLCQFAVEHCSRVLPRFECYVECSQKPRCRFGFIVGSDKETLRCEMCNHRQTVSRCAIDGDADVAKLVKDGTVRLCPRCKDPTMKDMGICNVIQCGRCQIWWNWRSRETGNNSVELKDRARVGGSLWEPGELEYQMRLQQVIAPPRFSVPS